MLSAFFERAPRKRTAEREDTMDCELLVKAALAAREKAYAPYSGFRVGAALLCRGGRLCTGCNIENAAYTPTVCAERTAFFKALSEGERDFAAIAVAGGSDAVVPTPPCGVCLQVMREFCAPDFAVLLARADGGWEETTLSALLPRGFGPQNLGKGGKAGAAR